MIEKNLFEMIFIYFSSRERVSERETKEIKLFLMLTHTIETSFEVSDKSFIILILCENR
jgi:hypothetical protein